MASIKDKMKGTANEVSGKFKQSMSEDSGNTKMHAEGKAQEFKGGIQKSLGKAKDAASGALKSAGNAVKKTGS